MRAKFDRDVYAALRNAGMSNREIAAKLGVSEAAVRRAMKPANERNKHSGLDPWPESRPISIIVIDEQEGTFVVDTQTGDRVLQLPRGYARAAEIGKSVRTLSQQLL